MAKKIISILLVLSMVLYLLPLMALAEEPITYLAWDEDSQELVEKNLTEEYEVVTADNLTWGSDNSESWYVVNQNISISGSVKVEGNVHLILLEDYELRITVDSSNKAGINVTEGNSLTIYGQGAESGKLTVKGYAGGAGIGGKAGKDNQEVENGGTVIIHSGTVTATGGSYGAGIGGGGAGYVQNGSGDGGDGGAVIIYGGTVTAIATFGGAGIGGGTVVAKAGGNGSVAIGKGNGGANNGTLDMSGYTSYEYWTSTNPDGTGKSKGTSLLTLNDAYKYIEIVPSVPDTTPPTPGGSGAIMTADVAHNNLTLNWIAASDNKSAAENLKYYVYQSASTMSGITPSGTLLNISGTTNIATYHVTGLSPNTAYYFIVVVEDEAGNKAAYTAVGQATTVVPDPVVNWPTDLTATYGQTLADITLPDNDTGTAGAFSWTDGGSTSVGNAGTRTFNLTFTPADTENYQTVSEDITVTVNPKALTADMLAVQSGFFTYNGTAQTTSITVTDGSTELVLNTDYENVAYSNNTNAGTATVSVTGMGNYTGTVSKNFQIVPASLTLMADDKTIVVGAAEPIYTYTVSGLVGGDTVADVITTQPTLSVSGFGSEEATTFQIVITGGTANGNYTIDSRVNGTLTVVAESVPVTGVTLNKTDVALTVGNTETLIATVTPTNATNKNVTWATSNSNVATVSNGVITAVSAGKATITVTTADGNQTATCTVTVTAKSSGGSSGNDGGMSPTPTPTPEPGPTPVDDTFIFTPSIISEMVQGQQSINIDNGLQITSDIDAIPRNDGDTIIIKASEIKDPSTISEFYQSYLTQTAILKGYEVTFTVERNNKSDLVTQLNDMITLKFHLTPEELQGINPSSLVVYKESDGGVITKLVGTFDPVTSKYIVTTDHLCKFYLVAQETIADPWTNPFVDVSVGDWFYGAVEYVNKNGLFLGTGMETFSPNIPMTRAMFWTVLGRLDGNSFTGSGVFDAARNWAMGASITDGTNPDGTITREQMVTILWRFAGSPKVSGDLNNFSDADSVASYAVEAMTWSAENGIVVGSNGALMPKDKTTRAQVATVLQRFKENTEK